MIKTIKEILEEAQEKGWGLFLRSYEMAQEAHKNDIRDGGNPYMDHIDAVIVNTYEIINVISWKEGEASKDIMLAGAALHDAYEDHSEEYSLLHINESLLKVQVGYVTSESLVQLVTDITETVECLSKKEKGTEFYTVYLDRVARQQSSVIIKIADILDNIKDLKFNSNRFDKYELTLGVLFNLLEYPVKISYQALSQKLDYMVKFKNQTEGNL